MNRNEHVAFGIATSVIFSIACYNPEVEMLAHPAIIVTEALIGSLLPDIDHTGSTIGNILPVTSQIVSKVGHRTYTHDIALAFVLASIITFFNPLFLGLWIGYFSHLFLDAMTVDGIRFFYLFNKKKVYILPKFVRFKASSKTAVFATWLSIFLFLISAILLKSNSSVTEQIMLTARNILSI